MAMRAQRVLPEQHCRFDERDSTPMHESRRVFAKLKFGAPTRILLLVAQQCDRLLGQPRLAALAHAKAVRLPISLGPQSMRVPSSG